MVDRVLFPGRFQPFHLGHMHAIKRLLEEFDEVVIVIGSAQEGFTCRNPFTSGERMEMIKYSLEEEDADLKRIWIVPIPDIHKPLAWTAYVLGIVPRVSAVASGNPHVIYLYRWLGVNVVEIELYKPRIYNGTVIRDLIAHGLPWEDRVPSFVAEYIKENDCVQRIKRLCGQVK